MLSHRATSRLRTVRRALALSAVIVLAMGGTAVADDVVNSLDTTVDSTAEVMSLNAGTDGTTTLYLINRNGDGKNGCNIQASESLVVGFTSSNPAVATASASDASFGACDEVLTVKVRGLSEGSTNITVTQSANNTGASFNFAPASFRVEVAPAAPSNTAPSVTVEGVTAGATYAKGSVPAATCKVTDSEDGPSSFGATLTGTLDSDGLGLQTASCSYTDAGLLPASASTTYSIADLSAPTVGYTLSPTDPDGLDGWYRNSVTLTWHVTESESAGSLSKTGCVNQNIAADQLATGYSCSATSSGGSAEPVTVTLKRDGNGPVVAYDPTQTGAPDGTNGWYVSPVTATFGATDSFSGVAGSSTKTAASAGDGAAVKISSPVFSDNAGNTTAAGAVESEPFKIDTVAPTVDEPVLSGTEGNNGWYVSEVVASFTGHDATSGVAGDNPKTVSSGSVQGVMTLNSPQFSDVAGNVTAAGARNALVKVDSIAPVITPAGGPTDGASYYFGSVPGAPTCDAEDATSGVVGGCAVTGYAATVGPQKVVFTAIDEAGNETVIERKYNVLAWTGKGFYSPVDMNGVYNTVKGGSTVPLKFELFAGQTELTDVAAVKSFTAVKVSCISGTTEDSIEMTSTGGTSLRYDATGGQFIQNWKTPTGAGTCYRTTMTAQDGTSISALFKVK